MSEAFNLVRVLCDLDEGPVEVTEFLVPLLPEIIRLIEKERSSRGASQFLPKFSFLPKLHKANPYDSCYQASERVINFFASMLFLTAVPYLIEGLRSEVFFNYVEKKPLESPVPFDEEVECYFHPGEITGRKFGTRQRVMYTITTVPIIAEGCYRALTGIRESNPEIAREIDVELGNYRGTTVRTEERIDEVYEMTGRGTCDTR